MEEVVRQAGRYSTHRLLEEADHHVGVHERRVAPHEGLGDVGHDAGVVPREALGSVDLHAEAGPGPLGGEPLRDQQVPETPGEEEEKLFNHV